MIDWLTLRCFIGAEVEAGHVCSVTADGEIEWRTPKRKLLEGSHSSTVTVRRAPLASKKHEPDRPLCCLEISGNPAKWFQGHNVFGTDDLPGLSSAFVRAVCDRIGHQLTEDEARCLDTGIVQLTRIDCTESWEFGTQPRALNAIRALAAHSHLSHRGRGSAIAEGTCIWGMGSRRWNGKAYAKGLELRKHPLPNDLDARGKLLDLADGLVRFEFTVRSMELRRRDLDYLCHWSRLGVTPSMVHTELMKQLTISEASMIDATALDELPPRLQAVYQLWKDGHDVRTIYPRNTFYRHRTALLAFGIDIATVQPRREDNVIPLRVVLVGKPLEIPAWARGTPLYFEPSAVAA